MTPEQKARVKIDQMFEDAGWQVVDRDFYSPTMTAAAIREGLLAGNHEADYFLFLNGKAVGILEAKREEVDVTSHKVCSQGLVVGDLIGRVISAVGCVVRALLKDGKSFASTCWADVVSSAI